jgi:hypothetical protein
MEESLLECHSNGNGPIDACNVDILDLGGAPIQDIDDLFKLTNDPGAEIEGRAGEEGGQRRCWVSVGSEKPGR